MARALRLARRGIGKVSPNPMVGAVLVKEGRIIGEGFHPQTGEPHAEIYALRMAGEDAKGAVLYVTLEPCNHYGKTPPCTEALIQAGIKEVVVARRDVNPRVAGKGILRLREAGIEVREGLLEEEAGALNRSYEKFITSGMPFVSLKIASTADGKIATDKGLSRWITSVESRRYVHELRRRSDAVLVGVGTVLTDNPHLTVRDVRLKGARQPLRVILDSHLRIPLGAAVLKSGPPTLIFTTREHDQKKAGWLREMGVDVIPVGLKEGWVDLGDVLRELGAREVVDLLVEGGASVFSSFLRGGMVDRIYLFVAPKVFGGIGAPGWAGTLGIEHPDQCTLLRWEETRRVGDDLLLVAAPERGGRCLLE